MRLLFFNLKVDAWLALIGKVTWFFVVFILGNTFDRLFLEFLSIETGPLVGVKLFIAGWHSPSFPRLYRPFEDDDPVGESFGAVILYNVPDFLFCFRDHQFPKFSPDAVVSFIVENW